MVCVSKVEVFMVLFRNRCKEQKTFNVNWEIFDDVDLRINFICSVVSDNIFIYLDSDTYVHN